MQREIVSTDEMRLEHENGEYSLLFDELQVPVRLLGMRQIVDHCGIPWRYACRCMVEAPKLLCTQVNHWFTATPTDRLLAISDGIEDYSLVGFKSPRQESRVTSPESVV